MPAINPLAMHDRSDLSGIRLHGDGPGQGEKGDPPFSSSPAPKGLILRFISVIGAEMVAFYRYLGILISFLSSAKINGLEVLASSGGSPSNPQ